MDLKSSDLKPNKDDYQDLAFLNADKMSYPKYNYTSGLSSFIPNL